MWQRTKRLINSYLDGLIERASAPDRDVRQITRAEIARLSELEVQTRASAKLFEKELAEVELKISGLIERGRLLHERGDDAGATAAARAAAALHAQRDLLRQQLSEAITAADKAKALRDQRKAEGEDLAAQTHLTAMREDLAGVQSPFSSSDPSHTIDEMRARLGNSAYSSIDARVAEADRELEAAKQQERVDEILARYKQGGSFTTPPASQTTAPPSAVPPQPAVPAPPADSKDDSASAEKSLGRNEGPVRPID
jgi:phage shock protein A